MKNFGIVLMILGVVVFLSYFNMDTTVTTEAKYLGYGVNIPSVTVNNIGLMEERRNGLITAGVLIVVGAIFFGAGNAQETKTAAVPVYTPTDNRVAAFGLSARKCPYCAEEIKAEAVFCRFCKKDLPFSETVERKTNDLTPEQLAALKKNPEQLAAYYGIEKDGNLFKVHGKHFERLFDAVAHAEIKALKRKLEDDLKGMNGA